MNRKLLLNTFPVLLTVTLLVVPFANVPELMLGSQSGKSFYFAFSVMALVVVGIISKLIIRNYTIRIKPLDAVIGLYFCYSALHPWLFGYSIPSIIWIETISLALFYLLVRQVSEKYLIVLLLSVLLAGMAQAIYGNLQLWGYFPSNHGIFRMTGSFFNPGPYAGFLAAILPVSMALYLFHIPSGIATQKLLVFKSYFSNKNILSYFKNRFPMSHFFYNNSEVNSSPQQQQQSSSGISDYITMKLVFLISIISICLVMPAARSRAAWLAVLVSAVYLINSRYALF